MKLWPWTRSKAKKSCEDRVGPVPSQEARQALEDSVLIKETAEFRWRRVDEAVERAMHADQMVRSQREQNHLREIVFAALHKDAKGHA